MRRWPFLSLIGCCLAAGGVFFLKDVPLLQLENPDRQRTLWIRVSPEEPFSLFYIHSIYRAPVVEEFRLNGNEILLVAVRTKHPGVMEYYRFEEVQESHPIGRRLKGLELKRTQGGEQAMIVKGKRIALSDLGEIGDRIRIRPVTISLGAYLLRSIHELLPSPLLNPERKEISLGVEPHRVGAL